MVGTEATPELSATQFRRRASNAVLVAALSLIALACCFVVRTGVGGEEVSPDPVEVSGDSVYRWQIGAADATLLVGDCVILHQGKRYAADSILLVVDGEIGRVRNRLVLSGMRSPQGKAADKPRAFTIFSLGDPKILSPDYRGAPEAPPSLMAYLPDAAGTAVASLDRIQQVQFATPSNPAGLLESTGAPIATDVPPVSAPAVAEPQVELGGNDSIQFLIAGGTRAVRIKGRGGDSQIESFDRPEAGETVVIARGGVRVEVNDVTARINGQLIDLGTVTLSAERAVGWLPLVSDLLRGRSSISQAQGELYLEGDIVFRQGEQTIFADSMYYNAATQQGMILEAESIATIPEYQGIVRLKADVMQQVAQGNFIAFGAAVTSSRMGVPRYWLQSDQLRLTERERLEVDENGIPRTRRVPYVSSQNNFVYVGGVPILYWPTFSTSLERPTFYVSGFDLKNDSVFGTQVFLDLDLFQLLGYDRAPRGVDWELSLDYLSERGPAIGTTLDYQVNAWFGVPGPVVGSLDAWVIDDDGLDTLGRDRIGLTPETQTRGRVLLRHRHYLPNDYELIAEVGYLSDRNFLEQYLENEWDREVDHRTALRLRKYYFSHLLDLSVQGRLNDFFTEEERLPQLDHYLIGGSLLGDRLTLSGHSKVGYSRLRVADAPVDPAEAADLSPIPGEVDAAGLVASTRQELSMPLNVGPLKVVPNVSGEVAHYGEAADGDSLTRLIGQAGIRTSLQMWRVDPEIQSSLLNVRGLAHKSSGLLNTFTPTVIRISKNCHSTIHSTIMPRNSFVVASSRIPSAGSSRIGLILARTRYATGFNGWLPARAT